MSDRPTPEGLIAVQVSTHARGNPAMGGPNAKDVRRAESIVAALRHYGYIIVHADDLLDWWENDEAAVDPYALIQHIAAAEQEKK